jgi:hypothetical protein
MHRKGARDDGERHDEAAERQGEGSEQGARRHPAEA